MDALQVLLRHSIDYAGLFPPAALDMRTAVRNYARYREGSDAWALGRFVVPVARLAEFESEAAGLLPRAEAGGWQLSALVGPAMFDELQALGDFTCQHAATGEGAMSANVVELKADSVEAIERIMAKMPRYLQVYIELPIDHDPAPLVQTLRRLGARAKVRTGGVTPEAFPTLPDMVRFIRACVAAGVPFKATAGLHHPLRGSYRLTYESGSPSAPMFGFLNLFLVAAWLRVGLDGAPAARLLEEADPGAFVFDDNGIEWRGRRLNMGALAAARDETIVSFGSCSFEEPIADLRSLRR